MIDRWNDVLSEWSKLEVWSQFGLAFIGSAALLATVLAVAA